ANTGNAGGERAGIFARAARRCGGSRRKRGVESGGNIGFGGKQQRQQPFNRAEFIYVRGPADVDARAASVEFWHVAAEVSVERNDCSEPVRAGDIHEPADIFAGYGVELFVRPGADGDELAVSAGRVVRGRRDPFEAELDAVAGIPR